MPCAGAPTRPGRSGCAGRAAPRARAALAAPAAQRRPERAPTISPPGPRATTSPLRGLGAGTAVELRPRAWACPGSPSGSTTGRSAAGSPCTCTGPSRRRLSPKRGGGRLRLPGWWRQPVAEPDDCWPGRARRSAPARRARRRGRPAMAAAASPAGPRAQHRRSAVARRSRRPRRSAAGRYRAAATSRPRARPAAAGRARRRCAGPSAWPRPSHRR